MPTHFEVFDLPPEYAVDRLELERRYLELSKATHPDRFVKAAPRERLEALARSQAVNDAYRVLKASVPRAEYLLAQEGRDVGAEGARAVKADPALLMDMMERNEALDEARADGDVARARALGDEAEAAMAEVWAEVEAAFASPTWRQPAELEAQAQRLVKRRYLARLLEQLEGDG